MPSSIVLKAKGLDFSPNALSLPNGSMSVANNVVIRSEDSVEPRRGLKIYGSSFGTANDRVTQLFAYKDRILRQYASTIQFDSDGAGTFSSFNGSYSVAQSGLRTKSIESNGNFYFTSSEGIKVISASSVDDLTTSSGFITNAGIPKAIDFKVKAIPPDAGSTGFLSADAVVAYKTTWALKDANSNLKIGTPSQYVVLYNSIQDLLNQDLMDALEALDNVGLNPVGSFINDGTYVNTLKVTTASTADTLRTNLIALAAKIDNDILFANDSGTGAPLNISLADAQSATVVRIAFSAGTATSYFTTGDRIYLSGFGLGSTSSKDINGAQTVTTVNAGYIEFNLSGGGMTAAETFTHASGQVFSYKYRNISQPSALSTTPTASELLALQTYLDSIIVELQAEDTDIIGTSNMTTYITPLTTTSSVNTRLTIQIPDDITSNHFLQIYRSTTVEASGTDVLDLLVPNGEETQLVYEAYPTSAEITAGEMIVDDILPDIFKGANLYTNASTGEGILQANDVPPFALDINKFKNYIFYANTKTRHRIIPFSLLGISNMISDYDNAGAYGAGGGTTPTITVSNGSTHNTYSFVTGVKESTPVTCVADVADSLNGKYFNVSSVNDDYYVWFKTSGGSVSDPAVSGRTGIRVDILTGSADTVVAGRIRDVLSGYLNDFTASVSTNIVTIVSVEYGSVTDAGAGTSGFTIGSITQGRGESISGKQILLSDATSVADSVDETARSMVRVINGNSSETIYLFYTSTLGQTPGKMVVESRSLSSTPFYIIGNNTNTGASFFPNISPVVELAVSAGRITAANPTVVTSATHGLVTGDQILITGSNSTPSIDGLRTVTVTGASTFTVNVNVTVAGTKLSYTEIDSAEVSSNEEKSNRMYYSKLQQPEAVPIVNFIDIGAEDKEILRIYPLRDSLFIFKEDGLYRLSGENAPFYVSLFDSGCICIAPDSVDAANNLVYAFTRQGVSTVSEAGVSTISRDIDTEILKISSSDYTSFSTSTWGVGYESDNSYTVFTVQDTTDTNATIGYRYSNLTNSWTTVDKELVCGIVNHADDKLYVGPADTNYIEQERKSFSRLDYADREISSTLSNNMYTNSYIQLSTVTDIEVGDVVVQEQQLTPYKFNTLLSKLDLDPGVGQVSITNVSGASTTLTITAASHNLVDGNYVTIANNTSVPDINGVYEVSGVSGNDFNIVVDSPLTTTSTNTGTAKLNYHDTLECLAGDNLRTKLTSLSAKLDTDPGLALTNYSTLIADISTLTITAISVANPTVITSASHGLYTGRYVTITGSNSLPSIDGSYTVTRVDGNTFTINEEVTTAGTTGSITVDETDFNDIKGCFNLIIDNLNADTGATFGNYRTVTDTTVVESVITEVNTLAKRITLRNSLDFIVGPLTIFKAIESTIVYSPNTMGEALGLKQLREATIMFMNKAFTSGTLSFATDLLPKFIDVDFNADGNGTFGSGSFGSGFFGGSSNSAPFRTLIPRNCQRCRYIVVKFRHKVARENYTIYGITITGNVGQSTRAYR